MDDGHSSLVNAFSLTPIQKGRATSCRRQSSTAVALRTYGLLLDSRSSQPVELGIWIG